MQINELNLFPNQIRTKSSAKNNLNCSFQLAKTYSIQSDYFTRSLNSINHPIFMGKNQKDNQNFIPKSVEVAKNSLINFTSKNKYYSKFIDEYKKQYPNTPLEDTVKDIILTTDMLNCGKNKKVFDFPQMEDYVVGYLFKMPIEDTNINPCEIPLSKYYFGQPIATSKDGVITIMKKVEGVTSSVNNHHALNKQILLNDNATEEQCQEYLSKLRMFKDFPQKSYDSLAERLKYINENSDLIDMINPNNLLIDPKNKQFNLIDMVDFRDINFFYDTMSLSDGKSKEYINECIEKDKKRGLVHGATISYGMYSLLLDSKLQPYFLDGLNSKEREEVISISKDVIQKCNKAVKKCGINEKETPEYTKWLFSKTRIVRGGVLERRYQEFLDLYNLN